MARLTPIERAIAGPPVDRREVYLEKMRAQGFTRVTALLHVDDVELVHRLAKLLRDDTGSRARLKHFLAQAEAGADGPERPQRSEDAPRRRRRSSPSQGQ